MSGQRRGLGPPAVGGGSLLVIFAVLCLTVFAALALTTVQADGRLSQKNADAAAAYYAADARAETILAQLRGGAVPAGVTERDGICAYTVTISDTQELQVEVRVSGGSYAVLRWQAVSTADWEPDDSLNLWNGE